MPNIHNKSFLRSYIIKRYPLEELDLRPSQEEITSSTMPRVRKSVKRMVDIQNTLRQAIFAAWTFLWFFKQVLEFHGLT